MERWEVFLRALAERVATANENNLTARCWKPSTLSSEIKAVIKSNQNALRATFPSARVVIEHLERMGWIHPVTVQPPKDAAALEFLLLDMEAGKSDPINPLELLQAYLPDGIVSYFSAINYHELTTQFVSHHHVARLSPARQKRIFAPGTVLEPGPKTEVVQRNPLGTEIFSFEDVGYYSNRRDAWLVPGIQTRVIAPRCWLRITTLEQTLLDGLMQPVRCGGEAVVLEAWETGLKQMDADRMAEHLGKIQREDLDRRVGAMLEMLEMNFSSSALGSRLNAVKGRLMTQDVPEIPLLTGLEFSASNQFWKVQTP
jgi:predicted transcriptional regulator of viral defense system